MNMSVWICMLPNLNWWNRNRNRRKVSFGYPMVSGQLRMEMVFQAHSWAHLSDFRYFSTGLWGIVGPILAFLQFPGIPFKS